MDEKKIFVVWGSSDVGGPRPLHHMQTFMPLQPDYRPDVEHRIAALRHEMVDVGRHIRNVDTGCPIATGKACRDTVLDLNLYNDFQEGMPTADSLLRYHQSVPGLELR